MHLLSSERTEILIEQQAAIFRGQFEPETCAHVAELIGRRLSKQLTATTRLKSQTEGVHSTEMELHKLKSEWADIDRLVRRTFAFARENVVLPEEWGDRRRFWPAARGHIMEPNARIGEHNAKIGLQGVAMLVGLAGTVEVDIIPVIDEPIEPSHPEQVVTTSLHAGDILVLDVEKRPLYQETNTCQGASTHMIVFERPAST